ncbi:hypothetical protein [Thiolapillus sp.]|uniref:hypothetical protein n=1 Tax=Thiolapillus sp. TaxID=2017437 RepID=UPI0025FC9994|nr:hypothetical protein [Thiolapillus sp.]
MKKKHVVVASTMMLTAFLGGCSSSPDKISAQYVSPLMYQPYDCDQIGMELRRVNSRLIEVTGAQESEANKDAVATGRCLSTKLSDLIMQLCPAFVP